MTESAAGDRRRAFIAIVIAFVIAMLAPLVLYPQFVMRALTFSLLACSVNLIFGYVGLLSFGHAAFYGAAAYVTGYSVKTWGLTPELGIALGIVAAAAIAAAIGVVAIRRSGIYFAMITFALAELVNFAANQMKFTGGENGLTQVPRGRFLGLVDLASQTNMYYFTVAAFFLGFLFVYRVIHSPFGEILRAIRDNETRTVSLGYQVAHYKLLAFTLSGAVAGLAGGLKTIVMTYASLTDVDWHTSGEPIMATLLGGLGTIWGPVVGGIVVTSLQNYLAETAEWATIIIGGIFVLFVLLLRRGIVGELVALRESRRQRRRGSGPLDQQTQSQGSARAFDAASGDL